MSNRLNIDIFTGMFDQPKAKNQIDGVILGFSYTYNGPILKEPKDDDNYLHIKLFSPVQLKNICFYLKYSNAWKKVKLRADDCVIFSAYLKTKEEYYLKGTESIVHLEEISIEFTETKEYYELVNIGNIMKK